MSRHILIGNHKSVVTDLNDVGQQRNRVDKWQALRGEEIQPKTFTKHRAKGVFWVCDGHVAIVTRELPLDDTRKVEDTDEDVLQGHHVCPVFQIPRWARGQMTIHETLTINITKNVSGEHDDP